MTVPAMAVMRGRFRYYDALPAADYSVLYTFHSVMRPS
jgi:hypothetical protein